MTEQEWLTSDDLMAMLCHLHLSTYEEMGGITQQSRSAQPSSRKLRLFAVACCRAVWNRITDDAPCPSCDGDGCQDSGGVTPWGSSISFGPCEDCSGTGRINRSRWAVEVAELFADGEATDRERRDARAIANWSTANKPMLAQATCYRNETLLRGLTDELLGHRHDELSSTLQAALLRDIFDSPFRPLPKLYKPLRCDIRHGNRVCGGDYGVLRKDWALLSRCNKCHAEGPFWQQVQEGEPVSWFTWNDSVIPKMAQQMYDSRDFGDMPILADALEDAGCTNQDILAHCRGLVACPTCKGKGKRNVQIDAGYNNALMTREGWQYCYNCNDYGRGVYPGWAKPRGGSLLHVRGCWVVDLLLGKS